MKTQNRVRLLLILLMGALFLGQASAQSLKPQRAKSYTALKRLLLKRSPSQLITSQCFQCRFPLFAEGITPVAMADSATKSIDYSQTNTQVAGVDEADIVKTDGSYIYQLANNRIRIIKANPATSELSLVSEYAFDDGFYATDLFVEGDRLVVMGNKWETTESTKTTQRFWYGFYPGEEKAIARVYSTVDKNKISLEREVELDGNLISSRKIGDNIYMLSRTWPRYYFMNTMLMDSQVKPSNKLIRNKAPQTPETLLPHVSDTAVNQGKEALLPVKSIYYFPEFVEPNYLTIASFQLSKKDTPAGVEAFYGSGDIVYASTQSLYLSAADYTQTTDANTQSTSSSSSTRIYKFDLQNGKTTFLNQGTVPGTLLNQFSMDEHDGYFRVATTQNQWSSNGETFTNDSWSNVYSLDKEMNTVGKLEKLAPGEQIYSTRFIGNRCYLVTFKQVDPLFVIDLTSPTEPQVLGELKIPGFSNYLHPYDENHILGFGRDTVEVGEFARVDGMKLALFDVSDVKNPKQKHSIVLGGAGSYSELLYDHKALWFDKKRNLMGFPVQIYKKPTAEQTDIWWSKPEFEGAYVFEITPENGFIQKAAISHQPVTSTDNEYYYWDYNRYIRRLLTIEDQLYTVSNARIQANDLSAFKETATVTLEEPNTYPNWYR